jgi:hypothetical protein
VSGGQKKVRFGSKSSSTKIRTIGSVGTEWRKYRDGKSQTKERRKEGRGPEERYNEASQQHEVKCTKPDPASPPPSRRNQGVVRTPSSKSFLEPTANSVYSQ